MLRLAQEDRLPVTCPLASGVRTPVRRRPALLVLALALLLVAAGTIWGVVETGVASPNAWIRHALVGLADAWLVPDVAVGGFSMDDPTTIALEDVRLTQDDVEVLACDRVVVSFGELPQRGAPLRIARIALTAPVLTLRRSPDAATWRPVGFDPLLEPTALDGPTAPEQAVQLSEVLDLRLVAVRDGVVVFDDGAHPPVRLDGITFDLQATPEVGPNGQPGHRASVAFGQPPGLAVHASGFVDLDHRFAAIEAASLVLDLSDPASAQGLSPGLRAAIERFALAGRLSLSAEGTLDLADSAGTSLTARGEVLGFHAAGGGVRLPIDAARFEGRLAGGLARIDEARLELAGGAAVLRQADLAVVDRAVALAGDWSLDALPLHALVEGGSASESVATGAGRLFVSSDDRSVGLTVDALTIGAPGRPPTLSIDRGAIRQAKLGLGAVPVHVEAIELAGVSLTLARERGAWVGIPAPALASDPAPPATPEAQGPASPVWPPWVRIDAVTVTDGALRLGSGGAAWAVRGLGVTVTSLGVADAPPITATLQPGGGVTGRASGTLDWAALAADLTHVQVSGPLDSAGLRDLLPASSRSVVTDLVPRGQLTVAGRAHIGRSVDLDLDATLSHATGRLAGLQMPVDAGSATLSLRGDALALRDVALTGARGRLELPAVTLDPNGALALSWDAVGLDLSQLRTAGGAPLATGRLSSHGRAVGQVTDAGLSALSVLDTHVTVDGGPRGEMRWPAVTVNVGTQDGARRLDARVSGLGGGQFDLASLWPTDASTLTVERAGVVVDVGGDARQMLPLAVQAGLHDLRAGVLAGRATGVLSLDDPVDGSTLSGVLELTGGQARWGDWAIPSLEGSLPIRLARGRARVTDGEIAALGGTLAVDQGGWDLAADRGDVDWRAVGLGLGRLRPTGGSAAAIEGRLDGSGDLALALVEGGLGVTGGSGAVTVRDGRLISLPALAALSQADGGASKPGDDALDARFRLDPDGATWTRLDLDLGPVRYSGSGWMRWTGALDLSLEGRRDKRGLADLAARLVAWRLHGTTAAPLVQALPLGVDTRTFEQSGPAHDALDDLDDGALDDLSVPSERAPVRPDLDIDFDDFDGFE